MREQLVDARRGVMQGTRISSWQGLHLPRISFSARVTEGGPRNATCPQPFVRDAVLVEDIAMVWSEAHRQQWSDAALSANLRCRERHIGPTIGRREVHSLTPELLQVEVFDPLERERVRIAKAVHASLIGMIDYARRIGMVTFAANPANAKDRKPVRTPLFRVLRPENGKRQPVPALC